jgi:hypothetical protein
MGGSSGATLVRSGGMDSRQLPNVNAKSSVSSPMAMRRPASPRPHSSHPHVGSGMVSPPQMSPPTSSPTPLSEDLKNPSTSPRIARPPGSPRNRKPNYQGSVGRSAGKKRIQKSPAYTVEQLLDSDDEEGGDIVITK